MFMGLLEDFLRMPHGITVRECYGRIYVWHTVNGAARVASIQRLDDGYIRDYRRLLGRLPVPELATAADMDFTFVQVIAGLMEWSYNTRDGHGIKIAAYAHYAINLEYGSGWGNGRLRERVKTSALYAEFEGSLKR